MKVIILSANAYKEKDAIVNALSEEKLVSFLVRGVFSSNSKTSFVNVPLSVVDVTFTQGNSKNKSAKTVELISSPLHATDSLSQLSTIALISDLCSKLVSDEEKHLLYPHLMKILSSLDKGVPPYMPLSYLIGEILAITGYELNLSNCVRCGKTSDIVEFSFIEGGFLCKDCFDEEINSHLTVEQMKVLRHAILSKDNEFPFDKFSLEDTKVVFNKLMEFIYDCFSVKFKNIENI